MTVEIKIGLNSTYGLLCLHQTKTLCAACESGSAVEEEMQSV